MSEQPAKGTLVRGADGALYFIPDSVLEPFRLSDAQAASMDQAAASQPGADDGSHAQRVAVDLAWGNVHHHAQPADVALGNIHQTAALGIIHSDIAAGILHSAGTQEEKPAAEDE
jgi:hypothetical protein